MGSAFGQSAAQAAVTAGQAGPMSGKPAGVDHLPKLLGYDSVDLVPQADTIGALPAARCAPEEAAVFLPHAWQAGALPPLGAFEASGSPFIVTGDPLCFNQAIDGSRDPGTHMPLNAFVPVESDSFKGRMLIFSKGAPGTPADEFKGTRFLGKTVIQGQFKRRIPAEDLWIGQELLKKPLLPASFQKLVYTTAAKMFSSTHRVTTEGDAVGFLNPLLAMSHTVNVSRPGAEPATVADIEEDARLLSSELVDSSGAPATPAARQRYYDRPANLARAWFEPGLVYSFVICQSIMDLTQYKLSLGGFLNLDLCQLLNGQPLQMKCKDVREGRPVLSLLMWHRNLNYLQGASSSRIRRLSGAGSARTSSAGGSLRPSSSVASSLGGLCPSSSCGGSSMGHSRTSSSDLSSNSSDLDSRSEDLSRCSSEPPGEAEDAGDESCSEYGSCCSDFAHLEQDPGAEVPPAGQQPAQVQPPDRKSVV